MHLVDDCIRDGFGHAQGRDIDVVDHVHLPAGKWAQGVPIVVVSAYNRSERMIPALAGAPLAGKPTDGGACWPPWPKQSRHNG